MGEYHAGFNTDWLSEAMTRTRSRLYRRWLFVGGLMMLVVIGAGASLFHLARRSNSLQNSLALARTQQLAELGRLAGALAHEIRNPMNAIRLNLHTLRRGLDDPDVPRSEKEQILDESDHEVERLETLMRSILAYARPARSQVTELDLRRELQAAVNFMSHFVERDQIAVRTHLVDQPVTVHMDRDRLRQIMLNLLNNAREAVGSGGEIDLGLEVRNGSAEISIRDSGKGVPAEQRGRVFDPFFTTKEHGCGLGLALVKRFTEEAGGTVSCEANHPRGAHFRVRLPMADGSKKI